LLKKFVLVQYEKDEAVIPNESTFFGYQDENYKPVQLEQTDLFRKDKLGLKAMKENGQIVFLTHPAGHLAWNEEWFVENLIPYLKN
jgi:palmitoyl-protein thioesterase